LGFSELVIRALLPATWNTPIGRLAFFAMAGCACGAMALAWVKAHYAGRTVGDYSVLAEWYRGHRRRVSNQ
jgi:hypothetical protein